MTTAQRTATDTRDLPLQLESVLALRCEEQGEEEALQGVGIEPTPPPQQFGATVRQGRDGDRQLETRHTA